MKAAVTATLIAVTLTLPSVALSAADGEKIFKKCASCHKIGEGAKNSVGPVLTGVVGRQAGTYEGYKYSKYMVAAGAAGLVWDENSIFDYLENPTNYLRKVLDNPKAKAKMSFKLKKEEDRRAVIEYLATFSSAAADPTPPADGFCIVNASQKEHFFAVETREGARELTKLAPGRQLCSASTAAGDGVVSVFESDTGFEGCSRVIGVGTAEEMLEYVEFDRCRWGSRDG